MLCNNKFIYHKCHVCALRGIYPMLIELAAENVVISSKHINMIIFPSIIVLLLSSQSIAVRAYTCPKLFLPSSQLIAFTYFFFPLQILHPSIFISFLIIVGEKIAIVFHFSALLSAVQGFDHPQSSVKFGPPLSYPCR